MQSPDIIYPPVEYLFLRSDQLNEQAWQALASFSRTWNESHQSQFKQEESEMSVILPGGVHDPELGLLDQALASLQTGHPAQYIRGIVDKRKAADFEKAPWVQIVGDQYPLSAYANYSAAFEQPGRCERCGALQRTGALTGVPLTFDESVLDKKVAGLPHYDPPGLDLINLPNGAFLISARVAELFSANHIRGYELANVLSKATGQPSQRVFLLKAGKAILDACDIHTPRDPGAICPTCGKTRTGILGVFYVREEWLQGDELFSRSPSHLSLICVSNRLYTLLKEMGCKGMLPSYGLFSCNHTK